MYIYNMNQTANKIEDFFKQFGIDVRVVDEIVGPVITSYQLQQGSGVKSSQIIGLDDDLSIWLQSSARIVISNFKISVEIGNSIKNSVSFKTEITNKRLPLFLGQTVNGINYTFDLSKAPHLLVAGATGQGKSVGLNVIIASLISTLDSKDLQLFLIDPKRVEFSIYRNTEWTKQWPVVTSSDEAVSKLESLCYEMEDRYNLLENASCKDIVSYNTKFSTGILNTDNGHKHLNYIVCIIDEFADLMMTGGKRCEQSITRIAQLARAVGIHLVIATQRPSADVITGLIKANFPARISFRVANSIDSRTIINESGAEKLLGCGDMLLVNGIEQVRLQSSYLSDFEIEQIINKS